MTPTPITKSGAAVQIREARPDDHEAIMTVTLAAYQQYASLMPHWEVYRRHVCTSLAEDGPTTHLVAEYDGVVVGSVLLDPPEANTHSVEDAPETWRQLRLLAVAPEARGKGVGRALLDACIRHARAGGAAAVYLQTEDIMDIAKQMYERSGFVRMPQADFSPAAGVLVKGYRLSLDDSPLERSSSNHV